MHCYGNSDLDKIHRTRKFGLSLARSPVLHFSAMWFILKLEGVTIEKCNGTTLNLLLGNILVYKENNSPILLGQDMSK